MIDKEFIDDIAINGLSKVEAFEKYFAEKCVDGADIEKLAERKFNQKHNAEYYKAIMEEVHHQELKMSEWTRDMATKDLIEVKEALKKDIMKGGNRKQAVLMAYLQSIKELNLMNGYNETNVNVNMPPMTFIGFDGFDKIDNNDVIDIDTTEVKEIEDGNDRP